MMKLYSEFCGRKKFILWGANKTMGGMMTEIKIEDLFNVLDKSARSNEKLAQSLEKLSDEIENIHEKYRSFSTMMKIIQAQLSFLIALSFGILFTLVTKL
jgi:hypothetical protein